MSRLAGRLFVGHVLPADSRKQRIREDRVLRQINADVPVEVVDDDAILAGTG